MKAFVLFLKEVESTHQPAIEAMISAKAHGLDAEMFEGYTPSRADEYIKRENLKPYLPGPKLYKIKWNKGGVRGCMISHLEMWKKCVDKHRFVEPDPDLNREPNVEKLEHYRKGQQQLQGTYGYVLKPQTAKRLIRGAYEEGLTAADMFVKDLYCNIQVVTPRAVKVNNQESLTSNRDFYI